MKYKEFPNISIPEVALNWRDQSWHNDATAHSQLDLPNGAALVLWVAHDDATEREFPTMNKYLLEYQPNAREWVEEGRVIIYDGDELLQLESLIAGELATFPSA